MDSLEKNKWRDKNVVMQENYWFKTVELLRGKNRNSQHVQCELKKSSDQKSKWMVQCCYPVYHQVRPTGVQDCLHRLRQQCTCIYGAQWDRHRSKEWRFIAGLNVNKYILQ